MYCYIIILFADQASLLHWKGGWGWLKAADIKSQLGYLNFNSSSWQNNEFFTLKEIKTILGALALSRNAVLFPWWLAFLVCIGLYTVVGYSEGMI